MIDNKKDSGENFSDWYTRTAMDLIEMMPFADRKEFAENVGHHLKIIWEYQQNIIDKLEAKIEKLKKDIIELIDFGTDQIVTEKIVKQEKRIEILEKSLEGLLSFQNFYMYNDECLGVISDALKEVFGEEGET